MNISALCDKIELQSEIKEQVLAFVQNFDFHTVDMLQKGYLIYENMQEALTQTQAVLGEDPDNIKILSCMLKAAVDAYTVYQQKGIPGEIYFATMKCFPRFIGETHEMTNKLYFDRYWWTTRQVGCHLFRIGQLEYEMKHIGKDVVIGIHIPSDAVFCPPAVEESLHDAYQFFAKYYPSLNDAEYRCHSWLLDHQLKGMLRNDSNIVSFQNRFEIFHEGEVGTEFIQWLYNSKSSDYHTLPENTTLQINMKKHLLEGGVIRDAYGRLKEKY